MESTELDDFRGGRHINLNYSSGESNKFALSNAVLKVIRGRQEAATIISLKIQIDALNTANRGLLNLYRHKTVSIYLVDQLFEIKITEILSVHRKRCSITD
jgi:hypothetical protein